ncbi:hypothetical protein [Fusobacterium sp. SYSU M8D902]|uniref:hypothetical protein n=1 Tax=Fusobacterium sp. SYSU M8D902 TaxID=3159562 RepID=UPI0032E50602
MENLTKLNIILNNYIGMEQEDVEEFLEEKLENINNIIDISVKERVFVLTNFQIRLEYENLDPLDDYNNHLILKKFEIEDI